MAERLQTQRDRLRPVRASRPLQIVGIGIRLVEDPAQLAGEAEIASRDEPQFDGGYSHEGARAPYRTPQAVIVWRLATISPRCHRCRGGRMTCPDSWDQLRHDQRSTSLMLLSRTQVQPVSLQTRSSLAPCAP